MDSLLVNLHSFFKLSTIRVESFYQELIEDEEDVSWGNSRFTRFGESRWLSSNECLAKVIKRFPTIYRYFMEKIPELVNNKDNNAKTAKNSFAYKAIRAELEKPTCLVMILFVKHVTGLAKPFLLTFQSSSPLLPMLYYGSLNLVQSLMEVFLKPRVIPQIPDCKTFRAVNVMDRDNYLERPKMTDAIKQEFDKLDAVHQRQAIESMQKILQKTVSKMMNDLPAFDDPVIMYSR